ncbi:transcriptional regulator, LysR family [Roseovarius nanhaiticus]|uniref:Transcriptional regulator, LysR family n=1 Tax=Roseovarius nanhaiticus TaxID=573024 RepID=A0A1N7FK59_9RHOB|nr:LysR substrate-binding domain-containing protein [Roseovarius nanhaiticus]SEK52585.1 transcriptional regulator, LysR family [Roseovarius nanhaiticus]SIS00739.1 transcriptional regulator, LysR family [Roseovarius nanhaiticus]
MSQLPPLNGLRAFDVAGRFLNFQAAADELGVTQGAVAQQVRQLEAHLGVPLFERLPKGLAFTSAGRSYHMNVATAFEALRSATSQLKPEHGKVLVSVTPTFAAKWLIPNLPDFSARHPEIDLRILATEKVSSFHGDGIDLAVRQGKPPFGASLDAHLLFRQEVIAVASPRFVDGHSLPVSPEVLSSVLKLHDSHDLWPDFLRLLNIEDKAGRGLRLSQTSLAVDAALFGQGVALVSRFLVAAELEAGRLVQVTPQILPGEQNFYLLAGRKSRQNPAIDAVVAWFLERAEKAPCPD